MNLNRLNDDLEFVNQIGYTLSLEERTLLKISLSKILDDEKYDEILFWGKIFGKNNIYYIAIGLTFKDYYEFPKKEFFYSLNNFEFKILENIKPEINEYIKNYKEELEGNPNKEIYNKPNENNNENQNNEEKPKDPLIDSEDEKLNEKIVVEKIIELERLSYIVRAIDNEGSIIPVGSFKIIPNHELRYNDSFKGLKYEEALNISNWMYFRPPQQDCKKELISNERSIFVNNFLDDISLTRPKDTWNSHSDFSNRNITIRNLLWPGMIGYHKIESNIFGFCYFGNGLKNENLHFMIN